MQRNLQKNSNQTNKNGGSKKLKNKIKNKIMKNFWLFKSIYDVKKRFNLGKFGYQTHI